MIDNKEKKPREPWRVNKVAYIITISWAVVCFFMTMIGFNVGFPDEVSFMFLALGALPIILLVAIESKRKRKLDKEAEAEAKKAEEIRRRYDERQRQEREEERERKIIAEQEHESKALFRTTTRVEGVTFNNEEGINRQWVLKGMYSRNEITLEKYLYRGKEPAARLIDNASEQDFGNLSAELVSDLARKYPKTKWEAKINSLDSFWPEDGKKEVHLCKVDLFIYKDTDEDEIF